MPFHHRHSGLLMTKHVNADTVFDFLFCMTWQDIFSFYLNHLISFEFLCVLVNFQCLTARSHWWIYDKRSSPPCCEALPPPSTFHLVRMQKKKKALAKQVNMILESLTDTRFFRPRTISVFGKEKTKHFGWFVNNLSTQYFPSSTALHHCPT